MNRPSHSANVAVLVAVFLVHAQAAWAWQPAASSQTTAQQIVFQPPVEGTCRAESDSIARGRIVSISELEIVMITPQDRQVSFPTEGIRTIRTKDGVFQYEPANDDFSDAVRRASELNGVRIETIYIPQPTQPPPNQPGVGQGSPTFSNPIRPPAGGNNSPSGTQPDAGTGDNTPTYSSTPGFSNGPNPQNANPTVEVGNSTLRCGSCNNLIPADSRSGQVCPHCGTLWTANSNYQSAAVDTTNSRPVIGSVPVGGHGGPAPGVAQGGQAGQTTTPQPATAPAPMAGQGSNFSFDAMPIWQKAGAFLGFLAVLYMVINSRRR